MSLFPIRLKRGGTITIHLRMNTMIPLWVDRKDYLVYPNGERKLCYDRMVPYFPSVTKNDDEKLTISQSGQLYGGAPVLMAARYLQNEFNSEKHFMEMITGLRDDTHHYYTLKIPEDAPLGRYHFELEDRVNGNVWKSGTFDTDYFYVEQLNLIRVEKRGDMFSALVENPSPEPVLVQLCSFDVQTGRESRPELHSLKPHSSTEIGFYGAAVLLYRDGDELIRLTHEKEKSCLGNPIFKTKRKDNGCIIYSDEPVRTYELSGISERIWSLANGFIPRSIIRDEESASVYDEMLQMGLIIEID